MPSAAADMAAAAVAKRPPPPLPLPPGMCVADLPSLLKPVKPVGRLEIRQVVQSEEAPLTERAGRRPAFGARRRGGSARGAEEATRGASAPAPVAARQPSPPPLSLASGAAAAVATRGADERPAERGPEAEVLEDPSASPASASRASSAPAHAEAEAPGYLWMSHTDGEIARGIEHTLNDPGCLIKECDELFHLYGGLPDEEEAADAGSFWAPITSGWSAPSAPPRLSVRQLGVITQILIDKLGCRSEPVLERIGEIYHTAVAGYRGTGMGHIEFRGYVASVLTQIQRELEDRGRLTEDAAGAVEPSAAAGAYDAITGADAAVNAAATATVEAALAAAADHAAMPARAMRDALAAAAAAFGDAVAGDAAADDADAAGTAADDADPTSPPEGWGEGDDDRPPTRHG